MNYKKLLNEAPSPLVVSDDNGTILLINESAKMFFGEKDSDFVETSIMKLFDQSNRSFDWSFTNFREELNIQSEFLITSKNGPAFYSKVNCSTIAIMEGHQHIFTFYPLNIKEKYVHDLNERVKEQLAILNVLDVFFRHSDINEAISDCLPAICDGWRFPKSTIVRITLLTGEVFATKNFIATEWMMQYPIESTEGTIGKLEIGYQCEVPLYEGAVFLLEEYRLISILTHIIGLFIEQYRTIDKIKENEYLVRKITSQVPGNTYMFEIDKTGLSTILFASRGTEEFNHTYDLEFIKKNPKEFNDIIHEEDKVRIKEAFKEAYRTHEMISFQFRIHVNDMIRWRWLKAIPEKNQDGRVIWYGGTQDITPIVNYISATEQMLYDISHVIRRPITTILGLTSLMDFQNCTKEDLREISAKIQQSANELDKFSKELNLAYNKNKEISKLLSFDFLNLVDKRNNLFEKP